MMARAEFCLHRQEAIEESGMGCLFCDENCANSFAILKNEAENVMKRSSGRRVSSPINMCGMCGEYWATAWAELLMVMRGLDGNNLPIS